MITVNFYATVRMLVKQKQIKVTSRDFDVTALLEECEAVTGKRFAHKLIDENNAIIPGTMILIDGANIHHLEGTSSPVKDGTVVSLFPPGGGG